MRLHSVLNYDFKKMEHFLVVLPGSVCVKTESMRACVRRSSDDVRVNNQNQNNRESESISGDPDSQFQRKSLICKTIIQCVICRFSLAFQLSEKN